MSVLKGFISISTGGSGSVDSVSGSAPIIVDNSTPSAPIVTITQADAVTNGFLSSADWNTFNNKADYFVRGDLEAINPDGLSVANGLGAVIGTGTQISQTQSSALNNGFLSSIDWNTFNSKQDSLFFSTGLTNVSNNITANLSTGIVGGQSVIGGTGSGESLTLSSTSNPTKGFITFGTSVYDEANNRLGIRTPSPAVQLHVIGSGTATEFARIESTSTGTGAATSRLRFQNGGGFSCMLGIVDNSEGFQIMRGSGTVLTTVSSGGTTFNHSATAAAQTSFTINAAHANPSGTSIGLAVNATGSNNTTGGVTALQVNANGTYSGSGVQRIADFRTGSSSVMSLTTGGQLSWGTGLGSSVTHIYGPIDQAFVITGGTPIQTTTAQNGQALSISGGAAIAQSTGTSSATGGALNLTGGVGAPTSFGNGTGGAVNITGGAGTNSSGIGGNVNIQGGTASGTPGDVILKNDTTGVGNVRVTLNNVSSGAAGGFIVSATAAITGTTAATAPFISMTTGNAKNITATGATTSNPGGPFTITLGKGGDNSNTGGVSATGANGGAFSIVGGLGGDATSVGGINTGGNGSSFTLTAGTGGNAANGASNFSGNGGSISLVAGNGGTTGSGSATQGIGGDINLTAGNSVNIGASPRGGNVNITAGDTSNVGGGSTGGNVNLTAGLPKVGGGGNIVLLTKSASGASRSGDITLTTGGGTLNATGGITFTTGTVGSPGGNSGGQAAGNFTFAAGRGVTGGTAATFTGGAGGNFVFTGATGGAAGASATLATGGAGSGVTFTLGAGGNATGAGTTNGGNGGSFNVALGSAGTGSTANGNQGQLNITNGKTVHAASTTTYASMNVPAGAVPLTPANGDIWFDGTNIYIQVGGVTKQFVLI